MDPKSIFSLGGGYLAAILVLLVPGMTVLAIVRPRGRSLMENLATAAGLSLALEGIFAILVNVTGWRITSAQWMMILLLLLFCAFLAVLINLIHGYLVKRPKASKTADQEPGVGAVLRILAGLALFVLLVAFRQYQSRGLVLPAWVESVDHVFLVTKMVDAGGVPQLMFPELPGVFAPFVVFPFTTSIFTLLTGWQQAAAVLFIGQILTALISLSIFRLGMALFEDWKRAALAAVFTGFALTLPGFLPFWGRYQFITGMVLMPLGMAEIIQSGEKGNKGTLVLIILLVAGLFLADQIPALFLILFLFSFYAESFYLAYSTRKKQLVQWKPMAGFLLGLLVASDWLTRMKQARVVLSTAIFETTATNVGAIFTSPRDMAIGILALGGFLWAILERRRNFSFLIWSAIIFYLSVVQGLPPGWRAEDFAASLFIPAALLSSHLLAGVMEKLKSISQPIPAWSLYFLAAVSLSFWGIRENWEFKDAPTRLAAVADLEAMAWIRENTPMTARFFINTEEWLPGRYRGVDGGYWILSLTGRSQLLPPLSYLMTADVYYQRVSLWADVASGLRTCSPGFWKLVDSAGFQYLYLTDGRGSLQPGELVNCDGLLKVYEKNGITLFEIIPGMEIDQP